MLLLTTAAMSRAQDANLARLSDQLERFQLSAVAAALPAVTDAADRDYLTGRIQVARYEHAAALESASSCEKHAADAQAKARCFELRGEALAMRVAMSSNNWDSVQWAAQTKDVLTRAVELDANNARALLLLARFHRLAPWLLGGSERTANELVDRAVALLPASPSALLSAPSNRSAEVRAIDACDAKDYARAESLLRKVATPSPMALYCLATALNELNHNAEAIAVLARLTQDEPEFFDAQFKLGQIASGPRDDLARVALTKFVANAPAAGAKRLANANYLLGQLEERAGAPQIALAAYAAALRAKPGHNESRAAFDRLSGRPKESRN